MPYSAYAINEVFKAVHSSENGLTGADASERLRKYGKNILEEKKKVSPIRIFFQQFNSPVVWILLAALFISFIIGEKVDAAVILVILIINAVLGFIQEYNAEKEIEALKKLASLKALVIRDGNKREIDASEIVPGDVLLVKEGDKVPADARVIESMQLAAQESILTGESLPVKKTTEKIFSITAVSDQKNMLFSGTIITRGKGKMIVVRTGMDSEIGRIAKFIQDPVTKKPVSSLKDRKT